jgi:exopolysaccharide biosynthesis polyprenyl glycosylphosphotransferase
MLRRNWRSFFILFTLLCDTAAVFFAYRSAVFFRLMYTNAPRIEGIVFFLLAVYFWGIFILLSFIFGSYRAVFRSSVRRQFLYAGKAYVWGMLIVFASYDVFHLGVFPRRFAFFFVLLLPVFFIVMRVILNRVNLLLQEKGFGIHHVLVVGDDSWTGEVIGRFFDFPELGYVVKGLVVAEQSHQKSSVGSRYSVPAYGLSEVSSIVRKEGIDRVFVSSPSLVLNGFGGLATVCKEQKVELKVLSSVADSLLRTAGIPDIAGIGLYSPPRYRVELLRRMVKRAFDITVSGILIVIFSPVFFFASLAILIETGFPIIYKQTRSSTKEGKRFHFYKFRSMIRNADEMKGSLFEFNETDGALFKMKNDPRLTRVGKFIRKYSIDELPQLFNVLKGDMSLVGPRPLPPSDFAKAKGAPEFWKAVGERDKVKPGMTGLWQISGRSNIGFQEMVLLDLYYVENQSLLFDLEILFETVPVVLFGKGAY